MIRILLYFFLLLLFVLPKAKSQQTAPATNSFFLSPTPVRTSFFDHYISGMAFDKTGFLWIGSNKGLLRYDGTTIRKFVLNEENKFITANDVLYITQTRKEGTVFARLKSGTLYK